MRFAAAGVLLALLGAQALAQRSFERAWPDRGVEQLLYLPSGRHLKTLTLGFSNLAADALWIKAIAYFGGHALTDREYPWLFHILDMVTTLDPPFRYPYVFGGIVLSVEAESSDKSIALLSKGMLQYPGDWRFPFYIGFNCFYHQQNPEKAAAYMRYAASLPGRPQYLPRLAASLMAESGRLQAALFYLETMAAGSRDENERAMIAEKIADLKAGRVSEGLRRFLAGERAP
jgi:hypothetical protein